MAKLVIAVFFMALVATPAEATKWHRVSYVGPDQAGRISLFFLDSDSINKSGVDVTYWQMQVLLPRDNSGVDNILIWSSANCASYAYRDLVYARFLGLTKVAEITPPMEEKIAPDQTPKRDMISQACGQTALEDASVADPYAYSQSWVSLKRWERVESLPTDWRMAAWSENDAQLGGVINFIDAATIQKTGDMVTFWMSEVYERPTPGGNDHYLGWYSADCSTSSFRVIAFSKYIGAKLLVSSRSNDQKVYGVKPNTLDYALLAQVCGQERMGEGTVTDPYIFSKHRFARR